MNWILQRITDWRRERRIRALGDECVRLIRAKDINAARPVGDRFTAEILARSPQQVARMEHRRLAAMDPHERAAVEKAIRRHA